jgi:uncharacterized membrane protein YeiH
MAFDLSTPGAQLAFDMDVTWFGAILLGVVTAVTGGLLRDLLCQIEPVLLHRETIGTSCLAGAIAYAGLNYLDVSEVITAIVGGLVIVLVREISIKFDWHLPKI